MFKRKADGTYAFTGRFWTYSAIATVIIGWIGYRTQETADHTEHLAWETQAYAAQTQDCLNQLVTIQIARVGANNRLNDLQGQLNDNQQQWNDIWAKFIIDLSQISTDQPQSARDAQSKPIVDKFVAQVNAVSSERAKILTNRAQTLNELAAKPIPDPHCGQNLPR